MSREELLELGLSAGQVERRVRGSVLHRQHPGVYAVGTPTLSPRGLTYAGVRAVGGDAAAAEASAAGLLELAGWLPERAHVVTSRAVTGPRGVVVHRTRRLPDADVIVVDGIRTVTVTRLLLDAAAAGDDRRTQRWLTQARRQRVLDEGALLARSRGAPGGRLLRTLLAVEPVPDTATVFEDALAALIVRAGLPAPEREHALGDVRFDFYWPGLGLAAEADSWTDHGHRRGYVSDRDRDVEVFNRHGIVVLRFSYWIVMNDPGRVIAQLVDAAKQAARRHPGGFVIACR